MTKYRYSLVDISESESESKIDTTCSESEVDVSECKIDPMATPLMLDDPADNDRSQGTMVGGREAGVIWL